MVEYKNGKWKLIDKEMKMIIGYAVDGIKQDSRARKEDKELIEYIYNSIEYGNKE